MRVAKLFWWLLFMCDTITTSKFHLKGLNKLSYVHRWYYSQSTLWQCRSC